MANTPLTRSQIDDGAVMSIDRVDAWEILDRVQMYLLATWDDEDDSTRAALRLTAARQRLLLLDLARDHFAETSAHRDWSAAEWGVERELV